MYPERKQIIRYALDLDIENINTYSGYRGDLVVKITTRDETTADDIYKYATSIGVNEVVIKQNRNIGQFEVYCITEDQKVYNLKVEEVLNKGHKAHPSKKDQWDVWGSE